MTQDLDGPVAQSLRIGSGVLRLATVALAAWWAASNLRTVPPDSQAVTLRFGRVVDVREAGLVVAWPRPVEQVELLPGPQRQLEQRIDAGIPAGPAILDPASRLAGEATPATASVDLTGDGGVVLLDATLFFRVDDAAAYFLARDHVPAALRRLFSAAAVTVAARSRLDDMVVVRVGAPSDAGQQERRNALRGALTDEVNRRLRALGASGAPLGVAVTRADVNTFLPPAAKFAFDAVLEADQMAEQGLAAARTDAARAAQNADHASDALLAAARAAADERTGAARTHEAALSAAESNPASRASLVDQLYRERIAGILHQAGSVSTVDARSANRLLLPAGPMQ